MYFDRSERYRHVMSRPWSDEWRARDDDGLLHQLAAVEADERLLNHLARQVIYVADGHHRYETAIAFQSEVRSDAALSREPIGGLAVDWIMVMLVNAELTDLSIRATHRILLDADADSLQALVAADDPLLEAIPVPPVELAAALEERRDDETPVFGLVLPGDEGWLLVADADGIADRLRRERMSSAVRALDLAALHVAILDDRLGISEADVAAGTRLAYTRDEADARGRVARGEAAAAILVRPTRLEQLADVASAGDVMPQKSTYFYPKLLTGMVFNPLED